MTSETYAIAALRIVGVIALVFGALTALVILLGSFTPYGTNWVGIWSALAVAGSAVLVWALCVVFSSIAQSLLTLVAAQKRTAPAQPYREPYRGTIQVGRKGEGESETDEEFFARANAAGPD